MRTSRAFAPVDEYVLHWIDTLRTYFSRGSMDDVVQKLVATGPRRLRQDPRRSPHAPWDDYEFPVASTQPYLPKYLLNRERIEDIL
ncbi:hypothetical protein [Streptomyces spinoverrucosus]|uniref:hypothetical protein n=1 Tax=Streptomyces spinoverrucosus TaxID=284043 RepID=UPI001143A7F7|nr:hypothetical protein [Streptomyces spinoverrucosus]